MLKQYSLFYLYDSCIASLMSLKLTYNYLRWINSVIHNCLKIKRIECNIVQYEKVKLARLRSNSSSCYKQHSGNFLLP